MSTTGKKFNTYYIHAAIGIALLFGTGYLPPIEPITPMGMQILGVFLGTIYLWSTCEAIWPSILGILALGMTDFCTVPEAIIKGLGSPILWQILMIFLLAGAVGETNFVKIAANWLMSRKFIEGRPMLLTIVFLIGSYFLAALVNIPALLLSWLFFHEICEMVGYKKGETYVSMTELGFFMSFLFGNSFFPFTTIRAAMCGAYAKMTGMEIPVLTYMGFNACVAISTLICYVLAMKFIFRADMSKMLNFRTEDLKKKEQLKLTFREKCSVYGFIFGLSFVVLSTVLPKEWAFTQALNVLTLNGIFALIVVVLSVVRIDNKPLIDVGVLAGKYIKWGVLFIVMCILPVADALVNPAAGISEFFAGVAGPMFEGRSPYVLLIAMVVLALVLTNIGSNIGMAMLLMPVVVSASGAVGANTTALVLILIFSVCIAFILPGSNPFAAFLHGDEWITTKEIYKYGMAVVTIMAVLIIVVFYPLLNMVM